MQMNATSLYKRTEVIGRGKFGVVYKAQHKQTKQIVAIKVLNLDTEEDEVIDVQQEIQFLSELKNVPNITHYYGCILNDTKLWIIMDYCAGGSLRTLLKAGVLEERYVAVIVRELLITLSAVHKLGVIHRDLKAANVLISKEGNVQLCDFGVAAKITANSSKRTTMAGTPYWMAPEVIRTGDTYNSKADIWSLGITIYEIATGNPPYCDKDASWAMQLISKSTPPRLEGREFSSALKECIALCLDENPEERPSADDLMKCKLVKIYKNHPTSILKEVISRYLLWRDKNSSRDSVFINLENEQEDSVDDIVNKNLDGGYHNHNPQQQQQQQQQQHNHQSHDQDHDGHSNQIQVKWDFDSLSSREYIMENDIDLDKVNQQYNNNFDTQQENTYSTLPTLKAPTTKNNTLAATNKNSMTASKNNSKSTTEVPKSLQMLFEDNSEEQEDLAPPKSNVSVMERMESPTIEIPDMDSLSQLPSASTTNHPHLNKPPALYHSQSASGNLESRFSSLSTSPKDNGNGINNNNSGISRPRKKTISNTSGGTVNAQFQQASSAVPHTPPYTTPASVRTPSPKPPSSVNLLNATSMSKTGSPSKMKALQSSSNPLLQPINMKSENMNAAVTGGTGSHPPMQAPPQLVTQQSMPVLPTTTATTSSSSSTTTGATTGNMKSRRNKPGFIQMPTPSNTLINNMSSLTNDHQDSGNGNNGGDNNNNVNQFGINPAQAASMPVSMTPVTEKDHSQLFPNTNNDESSEKTNSSRSHQNSLSSQKKSLTSLSSHNLSSLGFSNGNNNPTTAPPPPPPTMFANRGSSNSISQSQVNFSLNGGGGTTSNGNNNGIQTSGGFPVIPNINGDVFSDTVAKQKLVNELDVMITLFNQGLEVLEEIL
ncbi:N-rich kinase, putative [Candida dubliniensis CD36]|uniref:non-specific serine/threonine protein kinase n=1 Tax=Candida dubliniensis (strain CD36 / ATCC MYA-646 / CBS 7987 / NCPF 3949 / NRRL Y-17841) TaxID=573826 RepID=B9WBE2_CANDC|nr:N-rich kinase, putative [Candida dubliniensis CD36]CAX43713.1 N-rich kinase, putative [Candida dubliniensis CD36]